MDTDSRSIFKVATFEHVSKNSSTKQQGVSPRVCSSFVLCIHFPIAHLLGYSNERMCVSFVPQKEKRPSIHPSSPRIYLRDPATDSTPPSRKRTATITTSTTTPKKKTTHPQQGRKSSFSVPYLLRVPPEIYLYYNRTGGKR